MIIRMDPSLNIILVFPLCSSFTPKTQNLKIQKSQGSILTIYLVSILVLLNSSTKIWIKGPEIGSGMPSALGLVCFHIIDGSVWLVDWTCSTTYTTICGKSVQAILDHKNLTGLAGLVKIWRKKTANFWLRSPLAASTWVKDPWNGPQMAPQYP